MRPGHGHQRTLNVPGQEPAAAVDGRVGGGGQYGALKGSGLLDAASDTHGRYLNVASMPHLVFTFSSPPDVY